MLIKTPSQIEKMSYAGKLLAKLLNELKNYTYSGMDAYELEKKTILFLDKYHVTSPFLNFSEYPYNICVSINEEIVHGFPSKGKIIKEGDIVSIDAGIKYKGYCTDSAISFFIGKPSGQIKKLLDVTEKSLELAIAAIRPGVKLGYIQSIVGNHIINANLGLIKDLTGHGIGKTLQEPPQIPNYGNPNKGLVLQPGMTFCIEPMVNCGDGKIAIMEDGWTIVSSDESLAAHFEHTILVTQKGAKVLTKL